MRKILFLLGILTPIFNLAQCFSDINGVRQEPVISTFATHGSGKYKNEILWLNWGAINPTDTKGSSRILSNSDYTNAEIKINDNKFICLKTRILDVSKVSSDKINPIYSIMDESYTNADNSMFHILRSTNDKNLSNIQFESFAFIRSREAIGKQYVDEPIKINGLIFADAESANSVEYFNLSAKGKWNIIEFINLTNSKYNYNVKKEDVKIDNVPNGESKITMGYGEDKRIAAIAMLKFNEDAYASRDNQYKVNYKSEFKGGGTTAIAIGLLASYADFGDAPISYGSPIHFIENMETIPDNLGVVVDQTNIGKSTTFNSGALIKPSNNFMGTLGPDPNPRPVYSEDALGDDYDYDQNNVRTVLTKEEDSWPASYNRFSYKTVEGSNYPIGAAIKAQIPVKTNVRAVLAGWIDFNINGKFDQGERVYKEVAANTNGNVELSWTIPLNRKPFSTFSRLRLFEFNHVSENGILDPNLIVPSSDTLGGEVEDHKIQIISQAVSNPMLLNATPVYNDRE